MFSRQKLPEQPEVQQDRDRLVAIINSISEGFLSVDGAGVIDLNNGVALNILNTNTLIGQRISEVMPLVGPDGGHKDLLGLMKSVTTDLSSRDYRLQFTDGSTINLFISISPVRSAFGSTTKGGYVVLFRDITSEKYQESERDEFISVASHELRAPVAIAEGSVGNAIMLAQRSNIPDPIVHVLKTAHDQIIFLGNMINDLAMLSRADRGKITVTIEELDASVLLKSLAHDYKAQAEKKGLELIIKPTHSPPINTSLLYVREILQNFVTNALKYTETGSISIEAKASGSGLEFSVSDTGIGIGQAEQAKLFNKFFRSEDWRVQKTIGTGLGLYVAAKLARLIGASINMQSELNKGSCFVLHVPNLNPDQMSKK